MNRAFLQSLCVCAGLLIGSPQAAFAQADTAFAREVVGEINKGLGGFAKSSLIAKRPDVEYKSELTIWRDQSGVRKIEALERDDSGDVVTEYYYRDGALVFAYQAIKGYNSAGKAVTRSEERHYFKDGKMFKWLSGLEKAVNALSSADFATEAKARLATSTFFVQAAKKGDTATTAVTPAANAATIQIGKFTKPTSGTLTKLDMGDVACYLTLKAENGKAFDEMGDFDICIKQKNLIGKRVTLTYALENVMADECQGAMNCKKTKAVALVTKIREMGR